MKLRTLTLAAAAVACLMLTGLTASPARAAPITDNQWYSFSFEGTVGAPLESGGAGSGDIGIPAPDVPWTITLATPMLLIVTDCCVQGDEFELFDFGLSIGSTSAVAVDVGHTCGSNEIACLADPLMSHGSFLLAAGDHSLTGIVADFVPGSGSGFFIIITTQQVPEPGALALIGIALAGLAFSRRKRAA